MCEQLRKYMPKEWLKTLLTIMESQYYVTAILRAFAITDLRPPSRQLPPLPGLTLCITGTYRYFKQFPITNKSKFRVTFGSVLRQTVPAQRQVVVAQIPVSPPNVYEGMAGATVRSSTSGCLR